jgi:hypothetical protein
MGADILGGLDINAARRRGFNRQVSQRAATSDLPGSSAGALIIICKRLHKVYKSIW